MGRTGALLLTLMLTATATATAEPRVVSLTPVRLDGWLACYARTADLPGAKVLSSMESGLVSSVELELDVIDARRRHVGGRRIVFHLAFDLWDEIYTVGDDRGEHRLADLPSLRAYLDAPPPLRVAPLHELRAAVPPLAIRASLTLRPVAGPDRERIADVIAGAGPGDVDRREATFSFGRLIRFFSRGDDADPEGSVRTPPFQLGGLIDADD